MEYHIEIRPLATMEIIDAYSWYESQREGLGIEFLESLQIIIEFTYKPIANLLKLVYFYLIPSLNL